MAVKNDREGDEKAGFSIILRAVEAPARFIAQNAGVEGSIVVEKIKSEKGNVGYNAASDKYEDLLKSGVIDPKKVTRSALQNAASISGLLITTECLITDIKEEKEPAMPAGGGHGGGMGGMY